MNSQSVVVGMSGGVDSSVAALLLQQQGFSVTGVFMKNWEEDDNPTSNYCNATQDLLDAQQVCDKLNINLHKVSPILLANAGNAKDAEYQDKMLDQMTSPTEISDARSAAEKYIREKTANTGDTENAVAHSNKYFDDIEANRPMIKDKNGKTIKSRFLKPKELQEMQKKLSVNEKDFARPQWERSSATHIKASLVKRLDEIAKQENIKGWSETKKRMEIRFAIKKAIKALPKKAPRDFKKEMLKEIVGVASGALIAKTLGQNSLVGGLVGGLVQNQLHKKSYKQLSSKKERGLLERRAKAHPQNLLNGKPNKTPNKV